MKNRIVEYENGETTYRIVVTEATALIGMKRTILRGAAQGFIAGLHTDLSEEAQAETGDRPVVRSALDLSALSIMAVMVYPDLMSAAIEMDGLDLDMGVEEFANLPDALVDIWEVATYELNPHWLPKSEPETKDEEKAQKKAPSGDASASAPA